MKRPPRLRPGDTIGLIAPAGPVADLTVVARAVESIERRGYRVRLGRHAAQPPFGYLSGTDEERRADLVEVAARSEVKAVIGLKGGYGALRLLGASDPSILPSGEKIFAGFSDITTLLLAGFAAHGGVVFHGPMPLFDFAGPHCSGKNEAMLFSMLEGETASLEIDLGGEGYSSSCGESVAGILWGGNLSSLAYLAGTGWISRVEDSIVFFEEVDEQPYAIDRYLTRIRLAGLFDGARAFVVGSLIHCVPAAGMPSFSAREVIEERLSVYKVPVVFTEAFGHGERMCTLPIGMEATLDCGASRILLGETPVS